MKNKKPSIHPSYFTLINVDLKQMNFEPIKTGANSNSSCNILIRFAEKLNAKIPDSKTNTPFKTDLSVRTKALQDMTLNPNDLSKKSVYNELKNFINNNIHSIKS